MSYHCFTTGLGPFIGSVFGHRFIIVPERYLTILEFRNLERRFRLLEILSFFSLTVNIMLIFL